METPLKSQRDSEKKTRTLVSNPSNLNTTQSSNEILTTPSKSRNQSKFPTMKETVPIKETPREGQKEKVVYFWKKAQMTVDNSYNGVPRMVQIIENNKRVKEEYERNAWKYPNYYQQKEKKFPSKLQCLMLSQFFPEEFAKIVREFQKKN